MRKALIVGLAGARMTRDEAAFLGQARPVGLILFTRNLKSHEQIRALVGEVRSTVGGDELLVLIDQEGGRVQRLREPLGRTLPPAAAYAALYEKDARSSLAAAGLIARLTAADLRSLAINTNCTPVLDIPAAGAHEIIGNRALGRHPAQVAALGRAVAEGHLAGGVLPVIKHIPGHGRAAADSHLELPVVTAQREELERVDFAPFRALADLPVAMTAHVVFSALDPAEPASTSASVVRDVIRRFIGFDGLLMSDDLSMKALAGPMRQRAEKVIRAGSDIVLHCNGDLAEMHAAAEGTPDLAGAALARYRRATALLDRNEPFDRDEAEAVLGRILADTA